MTDHHRTETGPERAEDAVVIERILDAAPTVIWQMWTEPDHFRAWYGPTGASVPIAEMDVRPGGRRLICMEMDGPSGPMQLWFTGEYRAVEAGRRLVYTECMADATGRVLSPAEAGLPDGHPAVTEVIVDFDDLGGRTRMVMTHRGVPADSGGAMGWSMAFDKLAARLEAR